MQPKALVTPEIELLVETHGKYYDPQLLPADIMRGEVGQCFDWCFIQSFISDGNYRYVEGIVTHKIHGFKRLHAWLTDGVNCYDPTWKMIDNSSGRELPMWFFSYKGIEMPLYEAMRFIKATGRQGILANKELAPEHFNNLMKEVLMSKDKGRKEIKKPKKAKETR